MPISKQEQIRQRRDKVWELYSRGLTQEEIADELGPFHVTRRTIGYDIEWLRKDCNNFVKDNRKNIAQEYKKVMSNFEQLRREAWKHFNSKETNNNMNATKISLYGILESINNNIMNLLAAGDLIELELIEKSKERANETREDMDRAIESEAIF